MRPKLILLGVLSLSLFACKKSSNTDPQFNGPLLKQIIMAASDGSEKDTSNFYYDASGKLNKVVYTYTDTYTVNRVTNAFTRNSSGIITHITSEYYISSGPSTTWPTTPTWVDEQTVGLDAIGNYTYQIINETSAVGVSKDSIIYIYSNGRMSERKVYEISNSGISHYRQDFFFTDANGNLLKDSALIANGGGPATITHVETNTFDTSISAVNGYEFILAYFDGVSGFSKNNMIKTIYRDVDVSSGISNSTTSTYSYTFNSDNRPTTMTAINGFHMSTTTYTYY